MRNRRLNAPQVKPTSSNLADRGWAAARTRTTSLCGELLGRFRFAGREATPKVCGVGVARPQGHSWAPPLSNGPMVNVGTTPAVPKLASGLLVGGKARRRLTPPGWDGGPVVVRAQESCAHGEGVQRVRSIHARRGGRW